MNFKLEYIYGRHSLFTSCYTLYHFHSVEWSKPSVNNSNIIKGIINPKNQFFMQNTKDKNEMLSNVEGALASVLGLGVSECSERPIFNFFIKENWIWALKLDLGL